VIRIKIIMMRKMIKEKNIMIKRKRKIHLMTKKIRVDYKMIMTLIMINLKLIRKIFGIAIRKLKQNNKFLMRLKVIVMV